MLPEYKDELRAAAIRSKETKVFLARLRKKDPRDLDQVTQAMHEKEFQSIDCLSCGNCCRTTGPLLLNKDIDRLASHQRLRPSVFSEKYLRQDEDGDMVFKSMPCPFLCADNYCSVYEGRPNACREFPHTSQRNIRKKLGITYENTMICPGVSRIVENLKKHYKV